MTCAPASTRRRHTSTALYAAMPPDTPRTIRLPSSIDGEGEPALLGRLGAFGRRVTLGVSLGLGLGPDADDLVGRDLLEGDRQRLAGGGGDLRRDHAAEALGQLVVVRVDLPGPLGTQGDQGELRAGPLEEALDRGVHHRVVTR